MGSFPVYIVDAFVRSGVKNFTGNPAGVVILEWDDDIDDHLKQKLASELNQPATAFISRGWTSSSSASRNDPSAWTIKWFSPKTEIFLCGHGGLAASRILFSKVVPNLTALTLEARSGEKLHVSIAPETGLISLNFPSCAPTRLSVVDFPWVQDLVQKTIGSSSPAKLTVEDVQYSCLGRKILLRLKSFPAEEWDSAEIIRSVSPDLKGMMDIVPSDFNIVGVGVTIENNQKASEDELDSPLFYSRFFAPWAGIDEDEVCGSLHAILGPYWSKELGKGNEPMMTRFASTRTGDIWVKLLENNRVGISARANLVMEGTLFY